MHTYIICIPFPGPDTVKVQTLFRVWCMIDPVLEEKSLFVFFSFFSFFFFSFFFSLNFEVSEAWHKAKASSIRLEANSVIATRR